MIPVNREALAVVQVNYAFDRRLVEPDALLDRYSTLTGWSEAIAQAGASRVAVVQQFHRRARLARNGIQYVFCPEAVDEAVARLDPDVAHLNGLDFPVQTWRLRRTLARRSAIVVQDHASSAPADAGPMRVLRQAVRRRAMRTPDGFFFSASQQSEAWRKAGLISNEQAVYEVMEASTAVKPVPRDLARAAAGASGEPALLWVGRLNGNKDPLTILGGFEQCLPDLPRATLTMIFSEDELLSAVRARLQTSPALRDRVRLLGRVPAAAMAAHYSAADIFVLGSHHEGSGYALLEACACGLVPVVTDIPTFRIITANGALGALWTPGDAAGCARALRDVLRRDLPALKCRVVAHFDSELSWAAVGRHAVAAYRDIVARHRA